MVEKMELLLEFQTNFKRKTFIKLLVISTWIQAHLEPFQ